MANEEIKVTLVVPPNDQHIDIELDNSFRPGEIINNLIQEDILPSIQEGYRLAIKGGNELMDRPISEQDIIAGSVLRVLPNTDAGAGLWLIFELFV
uniref:Ubiquitin-like domain-containing protein n=1 Tax=Candidatus Kentrum sp. TC TaxID=2126339 RepID=A0A450YXR4_9GAMM|nr:MAG: hypothetical protein BECKTC1821E_GA0114239_106319 [Candidatus Kentron sp. TC]